MISRAEDFLRSDLKSHNKIEIRAGCRRPQHASTPNFNHGNHKLHARFKVSGFIQQHASTRLHAASQQHACKSISKTDSDHIYARSQQRTTNQFQKKQKTNLSCARATRDLLATLRQLGPTWFRVQPGRKQQVLLLNEQSQQTS